MYTRKSFILTAIIATAAVSGFAAPVSANHPSANPLLGTPVHDVTPDRSIVIDSNTRWVNVTGGETIRFVVRNGAERSFSWLFDTYDRRVVADLAEIAPSGILNRPVKAYVATDPRYNSTGVPY